MTALEYLTRINRQLDSSMPDCTHSAKALVRLLEAEGKEADVLRFGHLNEIGRPVKIIRPVRFPHRSWAYHDVCFSDVEIYDPLIGEPVPIHDYSIIVFAESVPYVTSEELKKLFRNATNRPLNS